MDRLSTLELFVAAAQSESFTKAAQHIGCSPTAASRAIAALEAHLGIALFRRSTRQVALTDKGAAYRDEVQPLLMRLRAAGRAAANTNHVAQGEIHITASTMFGRLHVIPVLTALLNAHAGLSARLLLIDRNVRLIEEGIDVAVRIGPLASSSLKAIKIAEVRPMVVASPDYLARRGTPFVPRDLVQHDLIASTGPRATRQWAFGRTNYASSARLTLTTVEAAIAAAEAGIGIASLLSYQVSGAMNDGRLIEVLGQDRRAALPVHLVFDGDRGGPIARSLFIDAMKAAVQGTI